MHHRSYDQGVRLGGSASRGLGRPPPKIHGILRDTVNKRTLRILLEYILVTRLFWAASQLCSSICWAPIIFLTCQGLVYWSRGNPSTSNIDLFGANMPGSMSSIEHFRKWLNLLVQKQLAMNKCFLKFTTPSFIRQHWRHY